MAQEFMKANLYLKGWGFKLCKQLLQSNEIKRYQLNVISMIMLHTDDKRRGSEELLLNYPKKSKM